MNFVNILLKKNVLKKSLIQLTTKDFLCRNANTGESCYSYMKDARPRTYYANVERPIEALKAVTDSIEYTSLNEIDDIFQLCAFAGKVTLVNFNTFCNQSVLERPLILESHGICFYCTCLCLFIFHLNIGR